jgi:AraC-like DNA-binding protein
MTNRCDRRDRIVARFEEFLEANPKTPLYLSDVCAALGTVERTFRAACEDNLGMGPIRFLALRRMHLVHRALLLADHRSTTVTQVATDHGFWELGRFSVVYHALFGETPAETLRQQRTKLRSTSIARYPLAGRQPFGSVELASLRP